jgi:DNA polymerase-3 subunit gamma/tau
METDTQSLTDRIRQLEEKIEKGIQISPTAAIQSNAMAAEQAPRHTHLAELPKAIPEDVQRAVDSWKAIMAGISMPMKAYLKGAYPSQAKDESLLVVVEDGLASDYFKSAQHKEELERIISDFMEKEIKITVQSADQGRNPRELFPDLTSIVSQTINMEVEEIEDGEEEPY